MKKILYLTLPLLILAANVYGQASMDSVLVNIAKNNKDLIANTKYWEAKRLEYQTGLAPYNPKLDYDYLIGAPRNAGNQTDFAITQSFDFPTVYGKRRQLSREQIKQADFQLITNRQEVLLKGKLICIELIYRNRLNSEVINRKQNTEKWLSAFQKSLEKGEGNVLDVNKAKLHLIEINADYQENLSAINQLHQKIAELNGGVPIEFSDTSYSPFPPLPNFGSLEKEIESNDPVRRYLEQEKLIGQNEVALARALVLPKIETGYHYQAILGQRFNGVHLGLTLPLWENKNIVETRQAELILNEANLQDHINKHYFDKRQKYERMVNLKITLEDYQALFLSLNTMDLLEQSLSLGQISTIEYFMEVKSYYEALKNYLRTEMEYNKVIAELYKYQL